MNVNNFQQQIKEKGCSGRHKKSGQHIQGKENKFEEF